MQTHEDCSIGPCLSVSRRVCDVAGHPGRPGTAPIWPSWLRARHASRHSHGLDPKGLGIFDDDALRGELLAVGEAAAKAQAATRRVAPGEALSTFDEAGGVLLAGGHAQDIGRVGDELRRLGGLSLAAYVSLKDLKGDM